MNLNKAFVLGNLTRDPEVRALPSGQQVTNFSIATNRYYTDSSGQKKEDTEFHNIVCFGKLADISARFLVKGGLCFIEGRIKTRNWQDQQGQKHYKTEIIAETLQLGPKGAGSGGGNGNYSGQSKFQPRQSSGFTTEPDEVKQEDIPVIEENYTPQAADSAANSESKTASFADNAADEIDVKDIPF